MFDKEIEAIAKCTELVKELGDDSKIRVVKYLIERFGIGMNTAPSSQQVTSPLSNGHSKSVPLLPPESPQFTEFSETQADDYPTLKDLLIKSYPKNEPEWILCYAFYASQFGSDKCRKTDIIELYKENGRWEKNGSNFAKNMDSCIKKDWIKSVNSTEYIIKNEGSKYVREILNGNSTGKETKSVRRKNSNEKAKGNDAR